MRKIDKIKQIDSELANSINRIIHDFNNLNLVMNIFSNNEDEPTTEYRKEHGWTYAREYYKEKGKKLKDEIDKLTNSLYEKEK